MKRYSVFVSFFGIWIVLVNSKPHLQPSNSFDLKGLKDLFEGDMLFENDQTNNINRQRRSVLTDKFRSWANGIVPYTYDTVFPVDAETKKLVNDAFNHIMSHTCVKFVKRTNENQYLNFTSQYKSSCHSFVGRVSQAKGSQELNLGTNCKDLATIVHEVMHALGFLHEQSRTDRDQYIVVNYTNVDVTVDGALRLKQFHIYDGTAGAASNQSIPYDYHSVMHYQRFLFSKFLIEGGTKIPRFALLSKDYMTIYAKNNWQMELGNQVGLSKMDILRINLHYNCPSTTPKPTTTTTTTTTTTSTVTRKLMTIATRITPTNMTTDLTTTSTNVGNTDTMKTTIVISTTASTTPDTTMMKDLDNTTKTMTTTTTRRPNFIFIGDQTFVVNEFGFPDSSNFLSYSFWNVLLVVTISVALQNLLA